MDAQQRDLMVKRVQEAHGKWPSYAEMPVSTETEDVVRVLVEGDPKDNSNYVVALHELSWRGVPIGRCGDEETSYVVAKKDSAQ